MSGRWHGAGKRGHWMAPKPGRSVCGSDSDPVMCGRDDYGLSVRRRRRYQHNEDYEEDTSATAAVSQSAQTENASDAPELPGFYFDREKNRYFRLLPGSNNYNPLTVDSIRAQDRERQRLQQLKRDESTHGARVPRNGASVTDLLKGRTAGFYSARSYSRLMHELKLVGMQRRLVASVRGKFMLMEVDSKSERIFALYNEDTSYKYGLFDLPCEEGKLRVEVCGVLKSSHWEVNSMSWASFSGKDSHILISQHQLTSSNGMLQGSVDLLPVSDFYRENPGNGAFSFPIATFSCAYGRNPRHTHCFSAGCSGKVVVMDVVTRHQQIIPTSSKVLAQCFAEQSPLLYCGSSSGEVWRADLRERSGPFRSRQRRSLLRHELAIVALHTLTDENYLLASDMAGKIKLWDVRTQRAVLQYDGHHNEHAILPLRVSEDENVIAAVGQDHSTRLWRLRDGLLLRTIPCPVANADTAPPSVALMSGLGDSRGAPGLLMAAGLHLFHYSY